MTYLVSRGPRPAFLALFLVLAACDTPPPYSEAAVQAATELKADSIALLQQANEPFPSHADEAARISTEASAEALAASRIPGNGAVEEQWRLITDPDGNLLGGTLARWETQGTLSRGFRDEVVGEVAQAFDTLICTEQAKQAARSCAAPAGGN
jgi:hypothetical protein